MHPIENYLRKLPSVLVFLSFRPNFGVTSLRQQINRSVIHLINYPLNQSKMI